MSLDMVGNSKGKVQVILDVVATVRQAGANIVRLEDSYREAFRDVHVIASAHLQREGIGATGHFCGYREDAVESMHAAKQ